MNFQLFWWISDTCLKKSSAFCHEKLGGVVKISFPRVRRSFWWKKRRTFWAFLSMSKIESQIFGLLTKLSLRASQCCFLLADRNTLMEKNFFWKSQYSFSSILHFSTLSQHIWLFVVNFPFDLSKLQSSWPKTCRWKPPFLDNYLFSSFLFYQRKRWNKTYWRFRQKVDRVVELHSMYQEECFLEKKEIFGKKTCFLTVWDMGHKNMAFCQFFPAVVPKLLFTCTYFHFFTLFGNLQHFLWLCDTWQKNFSLSPRNILAMLSKLHFHMFTGLTGGKNEKILRFFVSVEDWATSLWPFDKIFPAG